MVTHASRAHGMGAEQFAREHLEALGGFSSYTVGSTIFTVRDDPIDDDARSPGDSGVVSVGSGGSSGLSESGDEEQEFNSDEALPTQEYVCFVAGGGGPGQTEEALYDPTQSELDDTFTMPPPPPRPVGGSANGARGGLREGAISAAANALSGMQIEGDVDGGAVDEEGEAVAGEEEEAGGEEGLLRLLQGSPSSPDEDRGGSAPPAEKEGTGSSDPAPVPGDPQAVFQQAASSVPTVGDGEGAGDGGHSPPPPAAVFQQQSSDVPVIEVVSTATSAEGDGADDGGDQASDIVDEFCPEEEAGGGGGGCQTDQVLAEFRVSY